MKYLFLIPLFAACTKSQLPQPDCAQVYCISYKYTKDTALLKIDTLYQDYLCGRWLDTMRKQPKEHWFSNFCEPQYFAIEQLKNVIK